MRSTETEHVTICSGSANLPALVSCKRCRSAIFLVAEHSARQSTGQLAPEMAHLAVAGEVKICFVAGITVN